jgi:hypothetical protein
LWIGIDHQDLMTEATEEFTQADGCGGFALST